MQGIWKKCNGINHIASYNDLAWRIVENQSRSSTRKLVDSLEDQAILEDMLESTISTDLKLHPLLAEPFRYPPLKHGSRFGQKTEPSLWYGSLDLDTALAEVAFYRLNLLRGSNDELGSVETQHVAFTVYVKTNRAIKLIEMPFSRYKKEISSPVTYEMSQGLGTAMRKAGVQAITYYSARDPKGINIAAYTPDVFIRKKPQLKSFQSWRCFASKNLVEFVQSNSLLSAPKRFVNFDRSNSLIRISKSFKIEDFLVNNELPFPAI